MAAKAHTHNHLTENTPTTTPQPATDQSDVVAAPQSHVAPLSQRTRHDPHVLTPRDVLHLQRTVGNQVVCRLLAKTKPNQATHNNLLPQSATVSLQRMLANRNTQAKHAVNTIGKKEAIETNFLNENMPGKSEQGTLHFSNPIVPYIQRTLELSQEILSNDTLVNAFQFFKKIMGATSNEMFTAFTTGKYAEDKNTRLKIWTMEAGPDGQFGQTGLLIKVAADGNDWLHPREMTEDHWKKVNSETQVLLSMQINIDKLGTDSVVTPGATLGVNEVFNTLVHELILHATPDFKLIEQIRNMNAQENLAKVVKKDLEKGGPLDGDTQHEHLAKGTNQQYETTVEKATKILKTMENLGYEGWAKQGWNLNQYSKDVQLDRHTEEIDLLNRQQEAETTQLTDQIEATAANLTTETLQASKDALVSYRSALEAYLKGLKSIADSYDPKILTERLTGYGSMATATHEQLSRRIEEMDTQLQQEQQQWLAYQAHLQHQQWIQYQAALQQQWNAYYNNMMYPHVENWHVHQLHRILQIGKAEAYDLLTHPDDSIRLHAWNFLPQNR